MYTLGVGIKRISMKDFRSYKEKTLEFENGVNVIFGNNAIGKTNVLEGLFLASVGESFKARKTDEMVRFGCEFGSVKVDVESDGEKQELMVIVSNGLVLGKKVNKRKYIVNGVSRRKNDLLGVMPVVIFRPEDIELVSGAGSFRRKFMDNLLSQVDRQYGYSLSTYEQTLRRRNKILDAIREGLANRYALSFWDSLLIKHGNTITEKRRELVNYINELFSRSDLFKNLEVVYDESTISETRLEQYKNAEVAVGYTLVGPHKDDLIVKESKRELSVFGSRGEQRMAVLAMKMGEIYFLESRSQKSALLLLDDIFSELDSVHKKEVLRVTDGRQVVVTTADVEEAKSFFGAKIISL